MPPHYQPSILCYISGVLVGELITLQHSLDKIVIDDLPNDLGQMAFYGLLTYIFSDR